MNILKDLLINKYKFYHNIIIFIIKMKYFFYQYILYKYDFY